ncbi:hypothetical protein HDU98_008307 [Podochytrium sp. JEL0797]|nr:hypothetical protein HDU98_008307 [Podochytrium sp. JEL0797]
MISRDMCSVAGLFVRIKSAGIAVIILAVFVIAQFAFSPWSGQREQNRLTALERHLPFDFLLLPPPSNKPLKPHALITYLPPTSYLDPSHLDFPTLAALLQTHLSTHQLPSNTEHVVLITPKTPPHVRSSLTSVNPSVRILVVPPIVRANRDMEYTLLQVWRLEGVYESVTLVSPHLFFLDADPIEPLHAIMQASNRTGHLLGATRQDKDGISTDLLYLTPSRYVFQRMTEETRNGGNTKHGVGGFLRQYFGDAVVWIDGRFNARVGGNDTVGFHVKGWETGYGVAEGVWNQVRDRVVEMRGVQMKREGYDGVLVPALPDNFKQWERVRDSGVMYERVAVVEMREEVEEVEEGMQRRLGQAFAERNFQADYFSQRDLNEAGIGILSALKSAVKVLRHKHAFEWVWVVQPGVFLNDEKLIHVRLGEIVEQTPNASVVLFRDCMKERSGSLLIRRSAVERVAQLVEDANVGEATRKGLGGGEMDLLEELWTAFGGVGEIAVHANLELYWYQFESCKMFYPFFRS